MQVKQSSDLIKLAIAMLDFALISVSFYVAHYLRFGDSAWAPLQEFLWLYYFSAPLILLMLLRAGVLTGFRYQRLGEILKGTLKAFLLAGILSSTVLYLTKTADYSRLLFINYFALSALLVLVEKAVVKRLFERYLCRGGMNIRIAMVGFGQKFDDILAEIRENPQWGIHPARVLDPRQAEPAELATQIRQSVIDEVYVCYPRGPVYHEHIDVLLGYLEELGFPVRVALNFDDLQDFFSQQVSRLGTRFGVLLSPYNLDPDQLLIKRAMDIVGSCIGLLLTSLIAPFIAILIKLESSGPVFFSQTRIGKRGREFTIHKFRSMYEDAEERKDQLLEQNLHNGPLFKLDHDPRITKVGHIIRKYSIDELPQFWNALKGDMSLVGTRPPTRDEVLQYEDHQFRRISIKPGITGLWQVSGRNKITDFDDVVALDIQYIKRWTLWLDLKIIFRTVAVVLFPGRSGGM